MVKIIGLKLNTLEEREFESIKEANEYINSVSVLQCLNGKIKSSKGWIFRYKDKDFPNKAIKITDKRIKVYVLEKDGEIIKLPLLMLSNIYGIDSSGIIEASRGYVNTKNGKVTFEQVKGYKVREATKEEREKVLNEVSYLDYLRSFKEKKQVEKKISLGERIIGGILELNSIGFEREKEIPNTRLLMDIYVEYNNNKYCIEHHGVHHYSEISKTYTLEDRKDYDRRKKEYCLENNIVYIEISYKKTIKDIIEILSKYFGSLKEIKELSLSEDITINIDRFIREYKDTNVKHMSNKYGMKEHTIKSILKRLDYTTKRKPDYKLNVYNKETGEHVFTGGYYEVLEKYPSIQQSAIPRILRGDAKSSGGYTLEKVD